MCSRRVFSLVLQVHARLPSMVRERVPKIAAHQCCCIPFTHYNTKVETLSMTAPQPQPSDQGKGIVGRQVATLRVSWLPPYARFHLNLTALMTLKQASGPYTILRQCNKMQLHMTPNPWFIRFLKQTLDSQPRPRQLNTWELARHLNTWEFANVKGPNIDPE